MHEYTSEFKNPFREQRLYEVPSMRTSSLAIAERPRCRVG